MPTIPVAEASYSSSNAASAGRRTPGPAVRDAERQRRSEIASAGALPARMRGSCGPNATDWNGVSRCSRGVLRVPVEPAVPGALDARRPVSM